jgi:type VI secretion system secreted protein Hcp
MKFCASGKHVAKVELSICKAGGSQIEYSRVVLEDVLVTKTSFSGVGLDSSTLATCLPLAQNLRTAGVALSINACTERSWKYMYLKVDGVTGESNDSNHKSWIDVLSFSWAAEQPGNSICEPPALQIDSSTLATCLPLAQNLRTAGVALSTSFSGVGHTDTIMVNYLFQASKVNLHYWEQSSQDANTQFASRRLCKLIVRL